MNTGRRQFNGSASGPSDATLGFGDETSTVIAVTNTESWNGTNWTETNDLSLEEETL